jgi:methionyl-tRNA formyltransferase
MRFAIAAVDRYLGVFEAFVQAGWQPLKLFTVPVANAIDNHVAVSRYAARHDAAVQTTVVAEADLRDLGARGCDALIVACYPRLIRGWEPSIAHAVNFHCSPLPEGRGPYPVHRAILEGRRDWAVTCHRLSSRFDCGDILAAESFPLRDDECHESLDIKVQFVAKRLATRVAGDFATLWRNATPQAGGSYWPLSPVAERVIDFHQPVETILRHIRAFGATQSLAHVGPVWLGVTRAVGWRRTHDHPPGHVVHAHARSIVVAVPDGFVALLDIGQAEPALLAALAEGGMIPERTKAAAAI